MDAANILFTLGEAKNEKFMIFEGLSDDERDMDMDESDQEAFDNE